MISGFFDDGDLHDLLAVIRLVERRRPDKVYKFAFLNEERQDQPIEEILDQIKRVFPALPEGMLIEVIKAGS
jgi:hypothetical protein